MDVFEKHISICIPTYNRNNELLRLLSSIERALAECPSKDSIEVVVSDNGSTDGTEDSVRDAQKRMTYLRYSRNYKNAGFAANLNRAVEISSGKYLWLMGSDDYILPESLIKIINHISDNPSVLIGNPITNSVERKYFMFHGVRKFIINNDYDYNRYIAECREFSAAFAFMSTLIVKKEFWEKIHCSQYEREHAYTHMLRIIRGLAKHGGSVKCLNQPLVMTGHSGNEWNATVLPHFELDIQTIEYIVKDIFNGSDELLNKYGEIIRKQYSNISLVKSRVESSEVRWSALVPTLVKFGYSRLLIRKTFFDPVILILYLVAKSIRSKK